MTQQHPQDNATDQQMRDQYGCLICHTFLFSRRCSAFWIACRTVRISTYIIIGEVRGIEAESITSSDAKTILYAA